MELEELKGVVALIDEIEFMQRLMKQKDDRIKYLEDLKGIAEKTSAEKAIIKIHKELVEKNNSLTDAARDLLNDLDDRAYDSEPNPGQRNCMERLRDVLHYPEDLDLLTTCGTFNTKNCISSEDLCKLLKPKGDK
jgi:hypothetical protein